MEYFSWFYEKFIVINDYAYTGRIYSNESKGILYAINSKELKTLVTPKISFN